MDLVSITCIRNEEDIIEAFIRHSLTFVDSMILLDHGSTDSTPEILRELQAEKLPIHVITDSRFGHYQAEQMNSLLRLAAHEFQAEWVFCLDVDEFLTGSSPRDVLPKGDTPPYCKIFSRCYHVHPEDDPTEINPVLRITHRLQNESPIRGHRSFYLAIVPRHLALDPTVLLAQGNHRIFRGEMEPPFVVLHDLFVAHFPMRSAAQYAIKVTAKTIQDWHHRSPLGVTHSFYDQHYATLKQSYSAYSEQFPSLPLAYLPEGMDSQTLIRDPMDYQGGLLHHVSAVTTDSVITQCLALTERLAGLSGSGDENPATESTVPVTLKVDTLPEPTHTPVFHQPDPGGQEQTFVIPMLLPGNTRAVNLTWTTQPGVLEITDVRVAKIGVIFAAGADKGGQLELDILAGAIRIDPGKNRFLLSKESAVFSISCAPLEDETLETELFVRYRFRSRLSLSELLTPDFVRNIFKDQKKRPVPIPPVPEKIEVIREVPPSRETVHAFLHDPNNESLLPEILSPGLLDHVRPEKKDPPPNLYLRGNLIDFRKGGNSVSFENSGWCDPQESGVWSEHDMASLGIPLSAPLSRGSRLHIYCRSLPNRIPLLNVRVLLNDSEIGCIRLKSSFRRWRWVRIALPVELSHPLGHLDLQFLIAPPADPGPITNEGPPRMGMRFVKIA
ncbi:MAG: glycosyltransferase family 2 protein [Terrimicrobiaceae bacterium]